MSLTGAQETSLKTQVFLKNDDTVTFIGLIMNKQSSLELCRYDCDNRES